MICETFFRSHNEFDTKFESLEICYTIFKDKRLIRHTTQSLVTELIIKGKKHFDPYTLSYTFTEATIYFIYFQIYNI